MQIVLLQRPISPSAKMTVLSSKFTGTTGGDVCVGTPPNRNRNPTLSRKVQSELNLSKLGHMVITKPVAEFSLTSEFSVGVGDPLPGERSSLPPAPVEMTVDCDVVIALREVSHHVQALHDLYTRLTYIFAARCTCRKTKRLGYKQLCQRTHDTVGRNG
jgi:hypothetical protein